MIQGSIPWFSSTTEPEVMQQPNQLYQDLMEASYDHGGGSTVGFATQLRSIMCSLTVIKQKVNEVEALISMFLSQESQQEVQPFASLATIIQEIVVNSSSMMFNWQQMTIGSSQTGTHNTNEMHHVDAGNTHHQKFRNSNNHGDLLSNFVGSGVGKMNTNQGLQGEESFYNWYDNGNGNNNRPSTCNNYLRLSRADSLRTIDASTKRENFKGKDSRKSQLHETYDLVEPEAADLLAKYTHYCHVCGKGFKRDANLRMHMRAHGDKYKSRAALSNPFKESRSENHENKPPRKYSCPQQGCRWNKNHAKFQPLKSIICVKNHYKRSHCPKMYVCKRCNKKEFSVLSDLRTHEKHCGDRKWQCSCGTTFLRKDKLMGHINLFVGHTPIITQLGDDTKLDNHGELHIQFESSR